MKTILAALLCAPILVIISSRDLSAGEGQFSVGFLIGPFIPQDWQIQGLETATYSFAQDVASEAVVTGFGNGIDFAISGCYYGADWGLELEVGGRVLIRRKLVVDFAISSEYFENRLIVFPITLSFIHRITIPGSKVIPYLGAGAGVYISDWEQKFFQEGLDVFEREWLKGSANPVGIHFMAGFQRSFYNKLYFDAELRYSYVENDWELEDVDTREKTYPYDLNTGGTSLKLGLGHQF